MKRLLSIATLAMLTVGVFAVAPAEARWRDNDRCGNNGFFNGNNNNGNGFSNRRHNRRQMKRYWRHNHNRGWFNNNGNRFGLNTQARYW